MSLTVLFYGIVCAAGFIFAAHAHSDDREEATNCALILFGVWAIFSLGQTPYSPTLLLYNSGIVDMAKRDLWSLLDLFAGLYIIAFVWDKHWGRLLAGTFLFEEGCHSLQYIGLFETDAYYHTLDVIFLYQQAVLFAIGGPGVMQHANRILHMFGSSNRLRPVRALLRRKA